jgi:hypothetical protein
VSTIDRRHLLAATVPVVAGGALIGLAGAASATSAGTLTLIEPIRFLDSRVQEPDKFGPSANDNVAVPGLAAHAGAIINATVTETEGAGFFRFARTAVIPPPTSNINWWASGLTLANLAVVFTNGSAGISIVSGGLGRAHVVLDLLGYIG